MKVRLIESRVLSKLLDSEKITMDELIKIVEKLKEADDTIAVAFKGMDPNDGN